MNKLAVKLSAGLAAAGLVALSFAPSAFASTVVIGGNGAFSFNFVSVTKTNVITTTQSNTSVFTNTVTTTSNTGGNIAAGNTGGGVFLGTGDSWSSVNIKNLAGLNIIR